MRRQATHRQITRTLRLFTRASHPSHYCGGLFFSVATAADFLLLRKARGIGLQVNRWAGEASRPVFALLRRCAPARPCWPLKNGKGLWTLGARSSGIARG